MSATAGLSGFTLLFDVSSLGNNCANLISPETGVLGTCDIVQNASDHVALAREMVSAMIRRGLKLFHVGAHFPSN